MLENLVSLFAPHACVGCGREENRLLCGACAASLPLVPSRCYRCKAASEDYATCQDCASATPLHSVFVATRYEGAAKELVHRLKYERARAGAAEAARFMADALRCLPEDVLVVHVPTATSRVRHRGYDQARLIAESLAQAHGLTCGPALVRVGQTRQVGAGRAARIKQLANAFRVVRSETVQGRHILLVDDVSTTGATLESAARALKRAGAGRVSAIVFAGA